MAIKFFEGFDQHSGLGPWQFVQSYTPYDHGKYFHWSSLGWSYPLIEGRNGGQAITVGTQLSSYGAAGLSSSGDSVLSGGVARVGFWFRPILPAAGTEDLFEIGRMGLTGYNTFSVRYDSAGFARLYHSSANGNYDLLETIGIIDETWHEFEIYVDLTVGECFVYLDGMTVSSTGNPISGETTVQWEVPGAPVFNNRELLYIDDFWATDGESIRDTDGIKSVAVSCRWEGYEGLNIDGLRGSVVVNGSRYITDWNSQAISSVWIGDDRNVGHFAHYLFDTNPDTEESWSSSDLTDIAWGVCYFSPSGDGNEVRINALSQTRLIVENGEVRVSIIPPGNLTFYSGPWRKSNVNKTFSWHVRDIPMDDEPSLEDSKSLFIGGEGCLMFSNPLDPDDPDYVQPFDDFGVTFAQEYRDDYRDWKKIDGVGLSFDSYFVAGYGVFGDGDKRFQDNYITVNYKNQPNGGAYIQGLWDYATDPSTGRWSMRQQVYIPKEGYTHLMRRLKIRGQGRAMQIRVLNEGDKPFEINGWSMMITGNDRT